MRWGLDESTVMAFHHDPGCISNLLAGVINNTYSVPKVWRHEITAHGNKVCFIARLIERLSTEFCIHLKLQVGLKVCCRS